MLCRILVPLSELLEHLPCKLIEKISGRRRLGREGRTEEAKGGREGERRLGMERGEDKKIRR